ncbi:unnamed protein product [Meganyctiphanes norvegica]|uniref:C2H2-type domain-containing protein n=1 Tax=Meganyctiphanes norvegica TaxID=48144 RepID=A0AAV2QQ20_MEGNR
MYATEDKMYQCSKCNFSGMENGDLLRHMLCHAQEMEYTCVTCDVSFASSSSKIPTKCPACLVFTKPYECPDCSYRSSTSGDLKKHVRKHTGERPYTCSLCGSKYKRSNHLKRHMLIHSNHQLQQDNAIGCNKKILNLEDKATKRLAFDDLDTSYNVHGFNQADISDLSQGITNRSSYNIKQTMSSKANDNSRGSLVKYVPIENNIVESTNKVPIFKESNNYLGEEKSINFNDCMSQNKTFVRDVLISDIDKSENQSTNKRDAFIKEKNISSNKSPEFFFSDESRTFTKPVENMKVESEKCMIIADHKLHKTEKNANIERNTLHYISRQDIESLNHITDENSVNIHSLGIEHFLSITYSDAEYDSGKELNNSKKTIHKDIGLINFQNSLLRRVNTLLKYCICGKIIENSNSSQKQEKCSSCLSSEANTSNHKCSNIIKCFLCGKVFPADLLLKRHMREHREYEGSQFLYRCSKCDYKCAKAIQLKRHYMTHTGEKPFECTDCGYKCATNGDLKKHMPTHTGERSFVCSFCGYKYKRSNHLKRHMLKHSLERKFTCSICDFSCKRKDRLLKHLEKHAPHTLIQPRKDNIQINSEKSFSI